MQTYIPVGLPGDCRGRQLYKKVDGVYHRVQVVDLFRDSINYRCPAVSGDDLRVWMLVDAAHRLYIKAVAVTITAALQAVKDKAYIDTECGPRLVCASTWSPQQVVAAALLDDDFFDVQTWRVKGGVILDSGIYVFEEEAS